MLRGLSHFPKHLQELAQRVALQTSQWVYGRRTRRHVNGSLIPSSSAQMAR